MAYADRTQGSSRVVAIIIVALIHAVLGYAFVTGLAFNVVKKVAEDLNAFDVKEEPPPPEEEPPPPPPDQPVEPPPVVAPPPIVQTQTPPPVVIQTVTTPPPVFTPTVTAPPAPPAPPAPAAPPAPSRAAAAKGNPGSWVTDADYPPQAIRNEEQGRVGVSFNVNAQGRIENCSVTSSSGSSVLDDTTCRLVTRRGRYTPALDAVGQPTAGGRKSLTFRWVLPDR